MHTSEPSMKFRFHLLAIVFAAVVQLGTNCAASESPNFIVFLTDDQG